jgi:hypothetical protein
MSKKEKIQILAEREGFEPPDPFESTVFKTAAFSRSATSPGAREADPPILGSAWIGPISAASG